MVKKQNLNSGYLRPIIWRGGYQWHLQSLMQKLTLQGGWKWPVYYSKSKEKRNFSNISKWKRPPNDCAPTQSKCSGLYDLYNG